MICASMPKNSNGHWWPHGLVSDIATFSEACTVTAKDSLLYVHS